MIDKIKETNEIFDEIFQLQTKKFIHFYYCIGLLTAKGIKIENKWIKKNLEINEIPIKIYAQIKKKCKFP